MNALRLTHVGLFGALLFLAGCNQTNSTSEGTVDFEEAGIEWRLQAQCNDEVFDEIFYAPSPIPMREPLDGVETFFIVSEENDINLFVSKKSPSVMDGRVLGRVIPISILWGDIYPIIQFSEKNCIGEIVARS